MKLSHIADSVKTTASVALLGVVSALININPANALINFNMTNGVYGPNGETNMGAYSPVEGVVTIDFNDGTVPTTGFAKYTFSQGSGSSVRTNKWVPANPDGTTNPTSNPYLAVWRNQYVTIELEKTVNYFGLNWGSAHRGNLVKFYNGNSLIDQFDTYDLNKDWPGFIYQGDAYVEFYANSSADIFDRIEIIQLGSGGFETDNHSFLPGTKGFTERIPEPGLTLGLFLVGGFMLQRQSKKKGT